MTEMQPPPPPPLPVQPLAYATESRELWVVLSRGITMAAVALATVQLMNSSCQIGFSIVQTRASIGFTMNFANPQNVLMVGIELVSDALAALVLITALFGARMKGRGRSSLVGCLLALVAFRVITWAIRAVTMFTTAGFISQLGPAGGAVYFLLNVAGMLAGLLLPTLLIWLLTRPVVRMHYDAGVSTT